MKYQIAKDVFEELKNFEGKATFKGEETIIDLFVLLPESEVAGLDIKEFLGHHQATTSFEVEGNHDDNYTIIGINTSLPDYTGDSDYLQLLIVGG